METLYWKDDKLFMIDQTLLPFKEEYIVCSDYLSVVDAIKTLKVRGAPAIGVSAAYAMALAELANEDMFYVAKIIKSARPTAVNLMWAVDEVLSGLNNNISAISTANRLFLEDKETNRLIGKYGSTVIEDGDTILTHCNAGSLACVDYGTALGVIRSAWNDGKNINVIADETRPVLQGARLTAYELHRDGIPVKLIVDGAAGFMMQQSHIDKVIIGADRVCKGGIANKIGSLMVALAAKRFNIPFYVASPLSTFDRDSNINDIIIEERNKEEVSCIGGNYITSNDIDILNPAFDIVSSDLITGIITENGIVNPF
ncbi:MAG: S-methyl-5-thioribose-1-phosphate isomerase [Methanobacteriaceae archaeon]|nr:S-methyl-5-thioribose-1-phosphate isomerase [Methanobacteriaceae archaeon]